MPLMIVRSGRNPTEACISAGILVLLVVSVVRGFTPSRAVTDSLPEVPLIALWAFVSGVGAILTLIGLRVETNLSNSARVLTGIEVERAGQIMQGCGITCYVAMLWSASGWTLAAIPITMGTSLSVGAFLRAIQITRRLRKA